MPFHVGGHKPAYTHPPQKATFSIKIRLLVGGVGAFLICDGLFRFSHGQFDGVDFYSRPVYSTSFVGTGAIGVVIGCSSFGFASTWV